MFQIQNLKLCVTCENSIKGRIGLNVFVTFSKSIFLLFQLGNLNCSWGTFGGLYMSTNDQINSNQITITNFCTRTITNTNDKSNPTLTFDDEQMFRNNFIPGKCFVTDVPFKTNVVWTLKTLNYVNLKMLR